VYAREVEVRAFVVPLMMCLPLGVACSPPAQDHVWKDRITATADGSGETKVEVSVWEKQEDGTFTACSPSRCMTLTLAIRFFGDLWRATFREDAGGTEFRVPIYGLDHTMTLPEGFTLTTPITAFAGVPEIVTLHWSPAGLADRLRWGPTRISCPDYEIWGSSLFSQSELVPDTGQAAFHLGSREWLDGPCEITISLERVRAGYAPPITRREPNKRAFDFEVEARQVREIRFRVNATL
jgi:hypothetical protein